MKVRWTHSGYVTAFLVLAAAGMLLISQTTTREPVLATPETITPPGPVSRAVPLHRLKQAVPDTVSRPALTEPVVPAPAILRVSGTVTDEYDVPLESVIVQRQGSLQKVRSGPRGEYRLELDPAGLDLAVLEFRRSGYQPEAVDLSSLDIDQDYSVRYDVKLEYSPDSVTVDGWLSDHSGLAVAGQRVRLNGLDSEPVTESVSDQRGRFTFEAVILGRDYRLEVDASKEFMAYSRAYPKLAAEMLPLYVSLAPLNLRTLRGVVLDSYGFPVPGYEAVVRNMELREHVASLSTDELGRFSLEDFPLGEILVTHDRPGLLNISRFEVTELNHGNLVIPVDLGTHRLSGWVRDRYGKPVVFARVVLESKRTEQGVFGISTRMVKTDNNGFYEFRQLSAAEYALNIYARGFINEGLQYHPGTGMDKLYFRLSRWSDGL